ncbi:hypothetical protein D3C76_1390080 [compost metagenome]
MGADFGTLLDHAYADLLTRLRSLLLQSAGGGQASGAGTDDDDVEFHVFAFHSQSPQGSSIFCVGGLGSIPDLSRRIISVAFGWSNTNVCLNFVKP